jgi:hypothetical protein
MDKLFCCRLLLIVALTIGAAHAAESPASGYDALIQQGKSQLQAGSAEQAAASGKAAIKMSAERWESYALVGGALMNLKRYEEAVDALSKAITRAPEPKQAPLRDLRRQCLLAETGSPAAKQVSANGGGLKLDDHPNVAGPSYEATVKWIQAKFAEAGIPGHTLTLKQVRGATPLPESEISAQIQRQTFAIAVDSCNATITHIEPGDAESGSETLVYKFPLNQIQSASGALSGDRTFGRGMYGIPVTLIVTVDGMLGWTHITSDSDGTQTIQGTPGSLNRVEVPFGAPGTQDIPQHVAAAFLHLSEICKANPNQQGTKDLF